MELAEALPETSLADMLVEFGRCYAMPPEERTAHYGATIGQGEWGAPQFAARIIAYAARKGGDPALAERAWRLLLGQDGRIDHVKLPLTPETVVAPSGTWEEIPWISTNAVSQWCLNIIECLALIGDFLPEFIPAETVP